MFKLTLILLQITFATIAVLAKEKADEKRFRYIGSFPSNVPSFDMNNYYISYNPTSWTTAEGDCRNLLGPTGGLVAIETIAEWDFLRLALEQYGAGTTYWTSGFHDFSTTVWRFSVNNFPLPPYPPWGPSQPLTPISAQDRIYIYHTNRYDSYWRTQSQNELFRYICELRRSPC